MSRKPKPPTRFSRYRERAGELARSPEEVAALATAAARKLAGATGLPKRFREVREELATFIALLRAWVNGDYRQVSTRTIVTVIAAVLYFVVPFDLVPDFIAAIGLLDDAAVIGYVIGVVRDEISEFERWRGASPDREGEPPDRESEPPDQECEPLDREGAAPDSEQEQAGRNAD